MDNYKTDTLCESLEHKLREDTHIHTHTHIHIHQLINRKTKTLELLQIQCLNEIFKRL